MTPEQLLRETFTAHEHLADPERASQLARGVGPVRHRWVTPLLAAAVVLVVALGLTVLTAGGGDQDGAALPRAGTTVTTGSPSPGHISPAGGTNAENRAVGEQLATDSLAAVATYPGAQRVEAADAGPLRQLDTFLGVGGGQYNITRSRFLRVGNGSPATVARWYAAHPPSGWTTDGGPTGIGGSRNADGSWSQEVIYDETDPPVGAGAGLLVQVARAGSDVVVRITTFTSWHPARTTASLAADATSVTADYGPQQHVKGETQSQVVPASETQSIVSAFDALAGWPDAYHSCPYTGDETYTLTFHTPSGDLQAEYDSCYATWMLTRHGKSVHPVVADPGGRLLGLVEQLVGPQH